jgi:hypothetical protein
VVGLEGRAVGGSEGVGELLGGLGHVGAEGEAGEFETTVWDVVSARVFFFFWLSKGSRRRDYVPDEPQEALGGSVLLGLELVAAEVLDVLGLGGGGGLAVTEFLERESTHQLLLVSIDGWGAPNGLLP